MISPQSHINRTALRADVLLRMAPFARQAIRAGLLLMNVTLALIVAEISGETIAAIWGM